MVPDKPMYFVLGRRPGDNCLISPIERSFCMDVSTERAFVFRTGKFYSILGEHDIDGLAWATEECERCNRDHPGWDFKVYDAHAEDFPIEVDWEAWNRDLEHRVGRKFAIRNPAFVMRDDI